MTGTEETLSWLNESLQQYFVKEALLKHTALSEITVYRHRSTDMKLLVRRSRNRNDEVYRLLLTARLPHLPQIYEVISTPEELIVLEEYLEGEPLAARLESSPLSKAHAYRYTRQLCQAAGALHRRGIVHRDIKPSNILLCGDELKLIDFNISRQLRKEVQADTLPLGSIGYAPPEQFGLTQTGPTSDIYAIGVVFNEMLTGHSPAVELAPGYAGHIVQRCVRMRSEDRYPNAAALQQALRRPFWL